MKRVVDDLFFFSFFYNWNAVVRSEVDGKMIIEAVYMPSNRSDKLVKIEGCKCGSSTCICNLDLDVKHTVSIQDIVSHSFIVST